MNKINNLLVKFSFLVLVILLASCGSNADPETLKVRSDEDVLRISIAEAKTLIDEGKAVLVDARTAESYQISHASGAISLPESDVKRRHNELPTDQALIFYCT